MSRNKLVAVLILPLLLAVCFSLLVPASAAAQEPEKKQQTEKLAPFVPSPEEVVESMLKLAEVKPSDTVYDLGCGDGRIIIMAAQKFGANSVGVELDDDLYKQTSERIKELKLQDKVKVIHGDLLQVDLRPATVVTLYLLTSANEKLKPRLEKQLRKGARVVSHDFEVPGWKPAKTENVGDAEGDFRQHTIYLYPR
jgi:protein-L-isoaspartate O-methyltransferase